VIRAEHRWKHGIQITDARSGEPEQSHDALDGVLLSNHESDLPRPLIERDEGWLCYPVPDWIEFDWTGFDWAWQNLNWFGLTGLNLMMFGWDWKRLKCKPSIVWINNQNRTTSGLEKRLLFEIILMTYLNLNWTKNIQLWINYQWEEVYLIQVFYQVRLNCYQARVPVLAPVLMLVRVESMWRMKFSSKTNDSSMNIFLEWNSLNFIPQSKIKY
jgi:hypothetical protein